MPCALPIRSEEHTSELQSHGNLVCRLLLEKKSLRMPTQLAYRRNLLSRCPTASKLSADPPVCSRFMSFNLQHHVPDCECRLVFFLNDPPPPKLSPFPPPAALPI